MSNKLEACQQALRDEKARTQRLELALKAAEARLAEIEGDALLGQIAMRFVDRAGDTCEIDTAETICNEFHLTMASEVERQRALRGLPALRIPAIQPKKGSKPL